MGADRERAIQRLKALNHFIDDLYHDRRVIADGVVPDDIIATSANFLPACIGGTPPYGVWANICGTDLVRDRDGTVYALEDNLRVPSGEPYMLENRMVTKQVFAPVVDLNVNPDNPAIGKLDRAFSADPAVVARDAEIELEAHRAKGVRTALKHFPGLGSATANTDFGVADVTATWKDRELDPYRDLLGSWARRRGDGRPPRERPDRSQRAGLALARDRHRAPPRSPGLGRRRGDRRHAGGGDHGGIRGGRCGHARHRGRLRPAPLRELAGLHDPERVLRVIDLVERLVGEGRIAEARIDASVERLQRLFPPIGLEGAALRG